MPVDLRFDPSEPTCHQAHIQALWEEHYRVIESWRLNIKIAPSQSQPQDEPEPGPVLLDPSGLEAHHG